MSLRSRAFGAVRRCSSGGRCYSFARFGQFPLSFSLKQRQTFRSGGDVRSEKHTILQIGLIKSEER